MNNCTKVALTVDHWHNRRMWLLFIPVKKKMQVCRASIGSCYFYYTIHREDTLTILAAVYLCSSAFN